MVPALSQKIRSCKYDIGFQHYSFFEHYNIIWPFRIFSVIFVSYHVLQSNDYLHLADHVFHCHTYNFVFRNKSYVLYTFVIIDLKKKLYYDYCISLNKYYGMFRPTALRSVLSRCWDRSMSFFYGRIWNVPQHKYLP